MNLYQESLTKRMGLHPEKTFKNTKWDLDNYRAFLRKVESKLKKMTVISINLKRVNNKNNIRERGLYQYVLADKDKQNEEVEKLLFDNEIKYLYKTETQQNGEKHSDNRIEIQNRNGDEKQLWFDEDLAAEVTLYIRRDEYQIKMQIKAIERLRDNPLAEHLPLLKLFESQQVQKLDDIDKEKKDREYDWKVLIDDRRSGTSEQRLFVKKALATSDFALLEGPPGSGKTTTIIELIIQLCQQGKRILLCSSTHVAMDNVLKRVLTSYKEQCQDWVAPVRIAHDKGQIRYKEVEEYRLQELVRTKAKEVTSHLEKIKYRSESQEKLLKSLQGNTYPRFFEEAILESSNLVCGTMIGILKHPQIESNTIDVPFDVMIVDEASKVTFQEFLVPALYAKKWILVGDVQQLSPYVEGEYVEIALEELLDDKQKRHLETLFPIWKESHKSKKYLRILLSDDFDKSKARKAFDKDLEIFDIDTDFNNPQNDALALNAADIVLAKNTKRNREILQKYIYIKADVYEGFLNGEFKKVQDYFKNKNFNHTKKDRSTWQSELAHRLSQHYAYRTSPELGQHLQKDIDFLTPKDIIIDEKNNKTLSDEVERIKRITMPSILELLQNGLGKTDNKGHKLNRILYDGFPERAKELKFQSLYYQHRMNDLIAQTSRNRFYKGQLKTANTVTGVTGDFYVKTRNNPIATYKKEEQEVIWQTNAAKTRYDNKKKRSINANEEEANHIIEETKDFLEWTKTATPKPKAEPFEVAVLCFYRDQEALMRIKLRQLFKEKTNHRYSPSKNFDFGRVKVVLSTVDRFQGDEADMVLLSFTKASRNAFYRSPNRLNVALTRARYKLILFGNHKFFKDKNVSDALTELAQFDVRMSSRLK